jgi:hypothetical protein
LSSAEDIIEKLKSSFNTPNKKDTKLKVVVLCIVISTTFWFFSALNKQDYVTHINYPIKLIYNDSLYVSVGELPDKLPLEVTGGGWDLMTRSFGFGMKPLEIELGDPSKSDFKMTRTLRQAIVLQLEPVLINYILLDTLKFNIELKAEKEIALVIDSTEISLAFNFRITSPVLLEPRKVRVFGPKSILDTIKGPYKMSLPGRGYSQVVNETIDLSGLNTGLIRSNTKEVTISFLSKEFLPTSKIIEIVKFNFGDAGPQIFPSSIEVFYDWDNGVPFQPDTSDISLRVDLKRMESRDSTILIRIVSTSPYISNIRLSSSSVKLKYE